MPWEGYTILPYEISFKTIFTERTCPRPKSAQNCEVLFPLVADPQTYLHKNKQARVENGRVKRELGVESKPQKQ